MQPGDYPTKIRQYCKETGQPIPETDGALVRCVLESLAMKYRQVYQSLKPYITWEEKLYIVGGGAQNQVLNQFTANALGIPVITGASEATAVGNVMEQLYALGAYRTREEKCNILAASFETGQYMPQEKEAWDKAYERFQNLYDVK
jgi:sugar (pentulose or hexulose) kinase